MDQAEAIVTIGDWIARRRRTLDLTQDELARRAGCSTATLRKIEYGERRPSQQLASLLAGHLELPIELHAAFVKVARGFLPLDHLADPHAVLRDHVENPPTPPPARNLPTPLTTLIGRQVELDSIHRLLQDPACRLLTLIGPGGIGKTRLALEYSHTTDSQYPDGVYFISLAPLKPAEAILSAITSALDLVSHGALSLEKLLFRHLESRRLLLVIDNMEHVLSSATLLGEILERAPGVKILTTSRERLALQSEWTLEVHGLPVPASDDMADLRESSSVSLFVQRARQVQAGFSPDPACVAAIARICRLLEGMPLGIELAASWVNVLSCDEIAAEIENSLEFLTSPRRDLPERHRSLRAVVEHSWVLLEEQEKSILRRLSVFRGGFTRKAAEQIAQASLVILASLSSKSLLNRDEDGRYGLHELVRQYAAARLKEAPDEEGQAMRSHATYFAGRLGAWEPMFGSVRQKDAIHEMQAEIDNLRQAWTWMVEQANVPLLQQAVKGLHSVYSRLGWIAEAIESYDQAARSIQANPDPDAQKLRARLLYLQGYMHSRIGSSARSMSLYMSSLDTLQPYPPSLDHASALRYLADDYLARGDYDLAWHYGQQSLDLIRRFDSPIHLGNCLAMLGYIQYSQGGFEQSYRFFEESVQILRSTENLRDLAWSLQGQSLLARHLQRFSEAQATAQESLELSEALEDDFLAASVKIALGMIALEWKQYEQARNHFQEAAGLLEMLYYPFLQTIALGNLGLALIKLEQLSAAETAIQKAIQISMQIRAIPIVLGTLVTLANVRRLHGSLVTALAMVVFALSQPETNEEARQRAGECQAALLEQMDEGQVQAAKALAQALRLDEAISL